MTRLLRISGKILVAALVNLANLAKAGLETVRTRGNHFYLRHPAGRAPMVPVDAGEALALVLPSQILPDCALSPEDLRRLF